MPVTREQRTQQLLKAHAAARAAGRRVGGTAPYGWRSVDGRLAPDPGEQAVRYLMLHLAREGWSFERITAQLNALNLHTREGQQWTRGVVHRIVRRGEPAAALENTG